VFAANITDDWLVVKLRSTNDRRAIAEVGAAAKNLDLKFVFVVIINL